MKILYVGHTYTIRANQEKIAALANTYSMSGPVEITLVTPHAWRGPLYSNKTDLFDRSLAPNVHHHIVRAFFIGTESGYVFSPSIFRIISKLKPDIVHVEQGAHALSYSQILLGLTLFSPGSRALFFTWWNLPYEARGFKGMVERFNLSHSAAAIAGNTDARLILRSHGLARRIDVLPQLGIDLRNFLHPQFRNPIDDTFTVGYAGRITEEKGVLDLVHALAKMPRTKNVVLYMVGNGNALSATKETAAQLGIRLIHHNAVRNEELPKHLTQMDVLVLPSRTTALWKEQFGHILLEAMATGVPVIGSTSGEIPNVISDAGLIFPEGDIEKLAELLSVLMLGPEKRKELSALGRTRVEAFFTHKCIATSQMHLYDWILQYGESASLSSRSQQTTRRKGSESLV